MEKNDLFYRIKAFNANREAKAVQAKYQAMAESPLRFFRGTCHLFYEDLLHDYPFANSPLTWICGDLHLENFGTYRGENRLLYFDINDFDEAVQGPVLYDLSRLTVSIDLAASEIGLSDKKRRNLIRELIDRYTQILIKEKSRVLEEEEARGLIKDLMRKVGQREESALIAKRTDGKSSGAVLKKDDRLWKVDEALRQSVMVEFGAWFNRHHGEKYVVTDVGFRIAGTGSIGVRRYCCLLEGQENPLDKKLIDVKLASPSSILAYTPVAQPDWQNEAQRIVRVQEMMQHVPPAYLSSFEYQGVWYVVKELQPTSDKIDIAKAIAHPRQIEKYVADLGMLTASAQLRGSGRQQTATADELCDFAETGGWEDQLVEWASQYAGHVREDFHQFCKGHNDNYFGGHDGSES